MLKIGKHNCMVDVQNGTNLNDSNAYFIIEFECDNKMYIDWTGETNKSVRQRLYELMYYSSKKHSCLSRSNPDLCKAFDNSKYITVSVLKKFNLIETNLSGLYNELYTLIDEYACYAPNGYNVINQLNKCQIEKEIIQQFALKWGIPDTIKRNGAKEKSYSGRPVYEYKRVSEDTFVLHKQWSSVKEYADSVEPFRISPSAIYMCCNGQRRVAYGSVWRFDDKEKSIQIVDMRKCNGRSAQVKQVEQTLEEKISERIAKYKAKQLKAEEK